MFAKKAMAYDIDRDPVKEPSLAEMTTKALEILSKNKNGFFLMLEGSQVDWAAHANDPVGIRSEVLAFDKAVKVAKDFADKNPDTLVLVATDHGTGGMTFANNKIAKGYDKALLESFRSNIGWTTGGHVGGDVALYCYTFGSNIKKLSGTVHNSEIGKYLAAVLDLDLDKLTNELYIPARQGFEKEGATVKFIYDKSTNHKLEVTKDGKTITFPVSKSYALVDGEKVDLGGLVIYNTKSIYVPQGALELVK